MLYDQRLNRYDVARCLAEANLVQGDLLEILSQWPEEQTDNVLKQKIALSCCTYGACSFYAIYGPLTRSSGITRPFDLAL
jgi:hypothetical protein